LLPEVETDAMMTNPVGYRRAPVACHTPSLLWGGLALSGPPCLVG
jgi:hypothetical protein